MILNLWTGLAPCLPLASFQKTVSPRRENGAAWTSGALPRGAPGPSLVEAAWLLVSITGSAVPAPPSARISGASGLHLVIGLPPQGRSCG